MKNSNWIVEMTKMDHQTDITFTCSEREGAEAMIHEIAMETERTYEEDGEGDTRWLTIVNHKTDNWTVTVYFEANKFEKSRAEQERKHFMEQFKNMPVGIIDEPCRGSLDVGPMPRDKKRDDSLDALSYSAKLLSEKEIAKRKSFETFRSREDHKAYSRYCKMMLDSGQTPALFDEFKNWARQI